MNPTPSTSPEDKSISYRVKHELKIYVGLTTYFTIWFCSLVFLRNAVSHNEMVPLIPFSFALIKAVICAKFLMIGEMIFPIRLDKNHGMMRTLVWHSLFYVLVVTILGFLEKGVEGLFHHEDFFKAMMGFGEGNPQIIAALAVLYWLMMWPYLLFSGFQQILGGDRIHELLFGPPKNKA